MNQLSEQLNISYNKLDELTMLVENEELRKEKDIEDMKSLAKY